MKINEILNEAVGWIIYNVKTKSRVPSANKAWSTLKGAKAALSKMDDKDLKVAAIYWYIDNIQEK